MACIQQDRRWYQANPHMVWAGAKLLTIKLHIPAKLGPLEAAMIE